MPDPIDLYFPILTISYLYEKMYFVAFKEGGNGLETRQYQASGLLLLVAAIWGSTFVAVKVAVADIPPFTFNAIRFCIALLSLVFLYPRFKEKINLNHPIKSFC